MDKIENRFKIIICGDNMESVTETYRLNRYGKAYSYEMQKRNHKEASNG